MNTNTSLTHTPEGDSQQRPTQKSTPFDTLPQKKITGSQMKSILRLCGKNSVDFARFLEKSDNYVRQSLGYLPTPIPFTYYDALKVFVGEENFYCALRDLGITP